MRSSPKRDRASSSSLRSSDRPDRRRRRESRAAARGRPARAAATSTTPTCRPSARAARARGTTKPVPSSGWRDLLAVEGRTRRWPTRRSGISPHSARERRHRSAASSGAAAQAGTATITARASRLLRRSSSVTVNGPRPVELRRPSASYRTCRRRGDCDERVDELRDAVRERDERAVAATACRAARRAARAGRCRACVRLDQPREQRMHRQLLDVAGVDARRAAARRDSRTASSPKRRRMNAPIDSSCGRRARRATISARHAQLCRATRTERRRHEAAPAASAARGTTPPGAARGGRPAARRPCAAAASGRADRRARARGTASTRGRLLHEQRVGPAVDDEAVDVLGDDDAAGARPLARARAGAMPRRCSSHAAASPAMPPPTMTTCMTSLSAGRRLARWQKAVLTAW